MLSATYTVTPLYNLKKLGFSVLFLLVVLCLVFCSQDSFAQKRRANLEKQRKENQKKIERTNKILSETEKEKSASIGQLNAVTEKVRTHKEIIQDINGELQELQEEINTIRLVISGLDKNMVALKEEYAAMVYAASKADVSSRLLFLFSSQTFNQFVARLRYLDQYSKARRQQVALMKEVRKNRLRQQSQLVVKQQEKEKLLNAELTEKEKLVQVQNQQEIIISKLSKKEKKLKEEIKERIAADSKLEKLIADLIDREMRRAAREAKARARRDKTAKSKENNSKIDERTEETDDSNERIALTPEASALSSRFSENRRKLGWPVEAGFISSGFGKQAHPVLKGILIDNLGIDIQTNNNQSVKAVFEGTVGFVASVPGVDGKIVSIMHGDYYTVYCNLKNVTVNTGDKVRLHQNLGDVFTNKEGVSTLQFQVWHNNERLNPESWLKK